MEGIHMNKMTILVAMILFVESSPVCWADITIDRWYRLGEADVPAAVALGPGDAFTHDSGPSGVDAMKFGLTFYNGTPSLGGGATPKGIAPGSTESMRFQNVDSRYVATATLVGVTQNFGMEGYIQISPGVQNAHWFYNGGNGFPLVTPSDGYGLALVGGQYAALISGTTVLTGVFANPLQPVEMALVNTGGNNFSIYIQDTLVTTVSVLFTAPSAADSLSLGNFADINPLPPYAGVIDEARTFTFDPGKFDPGKDLGGAAAAASIPEPSSLVVASAITALGLLVSSLWRRKMN
jgi:hypothetical protein